MKHIIFYVLIVCTLLSCNYKELHCVVCHRKKKKTVTRYADGSIQIKRKEVSLTRAIDTPVKTCVRFKTYDSTGALVKKARGYRIRNVWDFDYNRSESKEIVYYPSSDSIKKEITFTKDGQVICSRIVRR